ncbi:MAG: ribosome silencing factor [Synergistaceae bacterium]|jgi:ribosome-associated protein|nr:ribosome silencing factor [Synergistaceae bacterium]
MLDDYAYICEALADKKGIDIVSMALGEEATISDVFVLVTGNSETHMKTLTDAAREAMERRGLTVKIEGENSTNWRLLDAGNVAVHVFSRKGREFYRLETLWGDAETRRYEYEL